jgi:hypothetical protein
MLDGKVLGDVAMHEAEAFSAITAEANGALEKKAASVSSPAFAGEGDHPKDGGGAFRGAQKTPPSASLPPPLEIKGRRIKRASGVIPAPFFSVLPSNGGFDAALQFARLF